MGNIGRWQWVADTGGRVGEAPQERHVLWATSADNLAGVGGGRVEEQ
jgi:hypothetical protein